MCARQRGVTLVLTAVAVTYALAIAMGQGNPDAAIPTTAAARRVVIVEGDKSAKVGVGDIVRVEGSGPSGMVEVSAKTEGPVKLIATNDIRRVVNGSSMIGAMIREFEVKAQGKGTATIAITVDNKIAKTTDTKEFKVEIR
jgi:hypothetical protein